MIAAPGDRDFTPLTRIAEEAFPETFELNAVRDAQGRDWPPVSVTWTTVLPIELLVRMGCGIRVRTEDGEEMDADTYHATILARQQETDEAMKSQMEAERGDSMVQ